MERKYMINKVFHGTATIFEHFQCPAYFAETVETAEFFAQRSLGKSVVMECTLIFENPLILDLEGQPWGGFHLHNQEMEKACIECAAEGNPNEKEYYQEEGLTIGFLAEYAEKQGYDGVIATNCMEENDSIETQYVVFHPENITIIRRNEVVV